MPDYCHSRENGNPGKSIPPAGDSRSPIKSRTSFAEVTALETFYETINIEKTRKYLFPE